MSDESRPPAVFKDRATGLKVFGGLTLLAGVICALFVPLIAVSQASQQQGIPDDGHSLVFAMFLYAGFAVALITLGIGSIKARRWARALLVIWSWSWVLMGIVAFAIMAAMFPEMAGDVRENSTGQPMSESARMATFVTVLIVVGFFFIVIPLVWALFYGGKNVRATCEARDPVIRWTDRCPLPVLAMSFWLGFSTLSFLSTAAGAYRVFPLFGHFATGVTAVMIYIVLAVVLGYCAWALYKLRFEGWLLTLVSMVLFGISGYMTYSLHPLSELYQSAGFSAQQIALTDKYGIHTKMMTWIMVGSTLIWVGYLLFVLKYFRRKA